MIQRFRNGNRLKFKTNFSEKELKQADKALLRKLISNVHNKSIWHKTLSEYYLVRHDLHQLSGYTVFDSIEELEILKNELLQKESFCNNDSVRKWTAYYKAHIEQYIITRLGKVAPITEYYYIPRANNFN